MSTKFSFIDLCDCSQVYFDFIYSSVCGIRHIADITDEDKKLNSIANTIENATENLEKLLDKYHELSKKEGEK